MVKVDNLDAAVSSRSTYAGADTTGTTTLLTRIPGVIPINGSGFTALGDARMANLDAAVTTRAMPADVTATFIAQGYTTARAGKIDFLDVAVSTGGSPSATATAVKNALFLAGTGQLKVDATTGGVFVAAAGLDAVIPEAGTEGRASLNLRQVVGVIGAVAVGQLTGADVVRQNGSGPITIKGLNSSTTRIVAPCDSSGNRTSVAITPAT